VPVTTSIIAIDENELKCLECGNDDPKKFSVITMPFLRDGDVGYTVSGMKCMVCQTSIEFKDERNAYAARS
jgi:hypothetical protein